MDIQFNNKNIIPDLTEYELTVLEKEFKNWERKYGQNAKFFAFVNVLWYSLSDAENPEVEGELAFPQNFTLGTLVQIMNLSDHLWKNYLSGDTEFYPPPQSTTVNGKQYKAVPAYRALMYFRDSDKVCHNLIGYAPSEKGRLTRTVLEPAKWFLLWWDDVINETNKVHSFMTLQNVTHLNLLG